MPSSNGGISMACFSNPIRRLLLLLVVAPLASSACTAHRDRFWPDTDDGLLAFTSPRVLEGDGDRLVRTEQVGGVWRHEAIRRVSHALLVGDRVAVTVAVPVHGEYRVGGGWVFPGREVVGTYGVAGEVLEATSNRPEVLDVSADAFGNLELTALAPGKATLTITATMGRRYATRPDDAGVHTDTVTFTVEP